MHNPAPEIVAAYPGGIVVDKDANPETTLGSAYSPVDYMSITSFPRLPEDDVTSAENTLKSRKDDDNVLSEQDTDPDLFLRSARLQRLPSSASDLASHDMASLQETTRDPFNEDCACQRDRLTVIITACLTFATGVTIALIMQIYVGDPQIFNQGAVVTDVAQCTSLGFDVLGKQGSSVDAAISSALCLGIIHPHTSGIGGGGVMLVHDIRKSETRVIDFRETAPSLLHEDMLLTNLQINPGLLVGVPGMLSGLHQAHQLYGRYYVATYPILRFEQAQGKGGVLTEDDFGNYSTVLQKPAETIYQGNLVMTAPAPHAGVALITALNILEGFNITSQAPRNNTFHLIAEAVKIALAMASELGDPLYDSSVSEIVSKMLSKPQASLLRQMINDTQAFPASHYTTPFTLEDDAAAAQVTVMGPDDHIVSVMSSLNKPFGSGIVTPSGILLNSQILAFSWPNKTLNSSPNPHNSLQAGKRPMSFLMPTAVRPAVGLCGTYVAVGSSNGEKALSGIAQVLMSVLSSRKNMSESLASGRLHPQLQPNTLLVDGEFFFKLVSLFYSVIGTIVPADSSALTMSNSS
uniref:Glutathione hydrolase n=1 Tax=Salarias fasciatus TaxID=181472 RepID=A0A672J5G4_SALFA